MDKEHKKTLWLMLAMIVVFAGLFFMVSGEMDEFLGGILPGYNLPDGALNKPREANLERDINYKAKIITNKGDIIIDLYELDTPYTVTNFVYLSEQGFYEGLTFHRVIQDVLIQGGDPLGDGSGGPGYIFDDEIRSTSVVKGSVAMAGATPNSNGSQFFIVTKEAQPHLDRTQTVFGEVISGMEVVEIIATVDVEDNGYGEISRPVDSILIEKIEIIRDSY